MEDLVEGEDGVILSKGGRERRREGRRARRVEEAGMI